MAKRRPRPIPNRRLFDFRTREILPAELRGIRQAASSHRLIVSAHAFREAREENVYMGYVLDVVKTGKPVSKDLPRNPRGRAGGINFDGRIGDGRTIRVKVGKQGNRYSVITLHEVSR